MVGDAVRVDSYTFMTSGRFGPLRFTSAYSGSQGSADMLRRDGSPIYRVVGT